MVQVQRVDADARGRSFSGIDSGESLSHTVIRQTFDPELSTRDVHQWDSRDLPNPPSQLPIARSDNIALMTCDPLDDTIVRIRTFMRALQPLEPRIPCDSQCDPILRPQLFQLANHTSGDAGDALSVQTVHHTLYKLDLVLKGKVDKVGIDEHSIRWSQLRVVFEKHR